MENDIHMYTQELQLEVGLVVLNVDITTEKIKERKSKLIKKHYEK